MSEFNLTELTLNQLVERFAEIGVAQYDAIHKDDNAEYRRLCKHMDDIDKELRARGRDARLALLKLFDYPNMQVRLMAATMSLGVAPVEARRAIQAIADSKWPPQAMDAGMRLSNLDRGIFVPD